MSDYREKYNITSELSVYVHQKNGVNRRICLLPNPSKKLVELIKKEYLFPRYIVRHSETLF